MLEAGQADSVDRLRDVATPSAAPSSPGSDRDDVVDGHREGVRRRGALHDQGEPSVAGDRAAPRVSHPGEQLDEGRLPRPVRPGDGGHRPGAECGADLVDHVLAVVAEAEVVGGQVWGVGLVEGEHMQHYINW